MFCYNNSEILVIFSVEILIPISFTANGYANALRIFMATEITKKGRVHRDIDFSHVLHYSSADNKIFNLFFENNIF